MDSADALDSLDSSTAAAINFSSLAALSNYSLGTAADSAATEEDGSVMNRPLVKAFFLAAYILVFVSCVVGNSMVLVCIIANRSMRTVTNFFLANLAIADLLVGIFCVCQNAAHFVLFAHGTWPFGRVLCHAYVYILHMIPNSSAGILVLLSVERFIAVLRPMLVGQLLTKSVLSLGTALVWTLSALMNIPYLIAVQYIELHNAHTNEHYGICTRRFLLWWDVNVLQLVSTVNLMVWYVLPLSLLLTIYASIGLVLMRTTEDDSVARTSQVGRVPMSAAAVSQSSSSSARQKYSMLNGVGGQPSNGANTHTPLGPKQRSLEARKLSQLSQTHKLSQLMLSSTDGSGNGRNGTATTATHVRRLPKIELVDSRKRVIRLCAVIVLAFAVLSLPRYIYLTWSVWREVNAPRCLNCLSALVQPTTFLLMFLASGINPILYAFLSQRFRAAIRDTFSFRKHKEQRKTEMMLLLRNHRLSEQTERDALGAPVFGLSRTMSSNSHSVHNGAAYRQQQQQLQQQKRSASARPAEESVHETSVD